MTYSEELNTKAFFFGENLMPVDCVELIRETVPSHRLKKLTSDTLVSIISEMMLTATDEIYTEYITELVQTEFFTEKKTEQTNPQPKEISHFAVTHGNLFYYDAQGAERHNTDEKKRGYQSRKTDTFKNSKVVYQFITHSPRIQANAHKYVFLDTTIEHKTAEPDGQGYRFACTSLKSEDIGTHPAQKVKRHSVFYNEPLTTSCIEQIMAMHADILFLEDADTAQEPAKTHFHIRNHKLVESHYNKFTRLYHCPESERCSRYDKPKLYKSATIPVIY